MEYIIEYTIFLILVVTPVILYAVHLRKTLLEKKTEVEQLKTELHTTLEQSAKDTNEHQRKEAHLRKTLLEKKTEVEQLKTAINTILKQSAKDTVERAELEQFYLLNACQYFRMPPPELPSKDKYWEKLSRWFRKERNWTCEECQVDLNQDPKLLHTHHMRGRGYNSPEHLKALCIACHSEVQGHNFKHDREYKRFIDTYGEQRRINMEKEKRHFGK